MEDHTTVTRTVRNRNGKTELSVSVARTGATVLLQAEGAGKAFKISLHGVGEVAEVRGAHWNGQGIIEVPAYSGKVEVSIQLK